VHGPEEDHLRQHEDDKADQPHSEGHGVGPIHAAPVQPGHDPVCDREQAQEPVYGRKGLASGSHALLHEIRIDDQQPDYGHPCQGCDINPELGDIDPTSRPEEDGPNQAQCNE
jgi:hypothetical protein